MQNKAILTIFALFALLGTSATAVAFGSAAHPHTHEYVGTSLDNLYLNVNQATPLGTLQSETSQTVSVVGACVDASPLFAGVPNIGLDADRETGLGGSCFTYSTVYGNDAGTTQRVGVSETILTALRPVYQVCIDLNGDGLCTDALDTVELCYAQSGHGFKFDNTPCTVYLDPLAANPAVFVQMIGALQIDGTVTAAASLHGFIYYE